MNVRRARGARGARAARGFGLIEFLIVVSIIAILVAILLPNVFHYYNPPIEPRVTMRCGSMVYVGKIIHEPTSTSSYWEIETDNGTRIQSANCTIERRAD